MQKMRWLAVSAVLAVAAAGCGKSSGTGGAAKEGETTASSSAAALSDGKLDGPAAAGAEFLEALRTGNDEKASKMLSATAREKTASLNRNVTPPASDTARFSVGKVDYVDDDGARVACTWTDIDEEGQPMTDQLILVLRREQDGWRVAGLAAEVFAGEPPLVLNFEDPADMLRQQQLFRDEMIRRRTAETAGLQAQGNEKQEKPVRR